LSPGSVDFKLIQSDSDNENVLSNNSYDAISLE